VAGDERIRVFCALRLPDDTLDRIVAWQLRELRDGRIVPRGNLHVTLAFLGTTPAASVPGVARELRAAAVSAGPIELVVHEQRGVRVKNGLAMLVLRDLHETARALAEDLFGRLEALGAYRRERRRWLPHVTVARAYPGRGVDPPELGRFSPSDAAVYSSVLRSGGAQYDVLESVALGG
jgi:RNA 2',3'-cyclic 3'-phosphodiesterase